MNMQIEQESDEPIIVMRRTFAAPRALVWNVLTDPKHVAVWYGGHGFTNPVCEMDVRPGGTWHHVMRTPDGHEFAMDYVFVEVSPPERLVWRPADVAPPPPGMHASPTITVTLEEAGAKTNWKLVARFLSVADRAAAIKMGFSHVLSQGTEKFDAIVLALARA